MNGVRMISPAQLRKLHAKLNELGLMDSKRELIGDCTDGRTTSSRGLTFSEARCLIEALNDSDGRQRQIRAIYHLAYKAGVIYGASDDDKRMNTAKLDLFCRNRGTVKKDIASQSLAELKRTHRQFERICSSVTDRKDRQAYLNQLEDCLASSLAEENYEICAVIRDEIVRLKTTKQTI